MRSLSRERWEKRSRPSVRVPVLSEQMHVHPPDVLDHHAAANQRLAAGQAIHADAEEEGEDDRKLFRDRRDRERHRAQQRVDQPYPCCSRTTASTRHIATAATSSIVTSRPMASWSGVRA